MAGGITMTQAIDLCTATLAKFNQDDVAQYLVHPTYEVINRWFATDKKVLGGGKSVTWDLNLKETGNGKFTRMYDIDTPAVANTVKEGNVAWTHYQNSFSWELSELAVNQDNPTRIFDLLKNRRIQCIRETCDDLEESAWKTPEDSTDDLHPHGLPGWLVQADADSGDGFVGYVGDYTNSGDTESAYSTVGGLACTSTTNAMWANYYYDHNGNIDYTLLKALAKTMRKIGFKTPKLAGDAIDPRSSVANLRIYTTDDVIGTLEDLAIKADDRVGNDLGKYAGNVVFKNHPLIYVDSLDTELTYVYGKNPIFLVNHEHFYPIILSGMNFKWSSPIPGGNTQHNTLTVFLDLMFAYVCKNRRAGGALLSQWEGS